MLSRSFFSRIPDQALLAEVQKEDDSFVAANRDRDGNFAFFYFPNGKKTALNLTLLSGNSFRGTWYDPRTGVEFPNSTLLSKGQHVEINPPSQGRGNDWVLILDRVD